MSEKRQKILLGVLVAMVIATVGDRLWKGLYEEPLAAAERRHASLTKDIQKSRQELKRFKKQEARLEQLRESSLPDDPEAARTLYQGWLTDVAERIQLDGRRVDSNPPLSRRGYRVLPFSLRCSGTLEQLTVLLYEFYRAPHRHHISTLTITPIAGTRQLSLSLTIEALLIGGTEREDALPEGVGDQLASDHLEDYQAIARRNFFSASGGVEAAGYTSLTAIVEVDGSPTAWFTNLLEDKVDQVHEGDRLRVGPLECVVEQILLRDVIVVIDGQRWLLTIDDRVADAIALPPEY